MGAGGLNSRGIILQGPFGSLTNQRKTAPSLLHPLWPWLSHLTGEGLSPGYEGTPRPQLVQTLEDFPGVWVWGAPLGPGQKREGVCRGDPWGPGRGMVLAGTPATVSF